MKSVNTDVAYDFIRRKILNGEYPPGYALMTEVLAKEIGVSRTPIRDACRKLETDGLVDIRPHLGASVKSMDIGELKDMCDMRLALETYAAGLAARNRTESDLVEIRLAFESMQRLTEKIIQVPNDKSVFGDLILEDVRFHIAIMSAAKNELMKKEILRLHLINRVVSGPMLGESVASDIEAFRARRRAVLAMHSEILIAIENSDVAAARKAMSFHISELIEYNLRIKIRAESGAIARELTPEEQSYIS